MLNYYPLFILLAPLISALLTSISFRAIATRSCKISVWLHAAAFLVSVKVLYSTAAHGYEATRIVVFSLPLSDIFQFHLRIDRLAAVMMTLIIGIGTIIHIYSLNFMQQEQGRTRFHTLLSATIFTLVCMVSSSNLLVIFLFWQIVSWLISMLAYNHSHVPTAQGAFRTFAVLRTGDVFFLAGIFLAYGLYGTLDMQLLFIKAAANPFSFSLWPGGGLDISANTVITLLIFIGGMSKSAQVPLHVWLPDSLYAPTQVHALLHAGIINAGGFLLNRLAPLYGTSSSTLHVVFAIGALTTFFGASMMLVQSDIKKTLGYSTIGQMGYMIMECGLGAFALAVFHLVAHGLFKATVFLNCGHVIQAARQEPRHPEKEDGNGDATHGFSRLPWIAGFVTTLILPFVIVLAAHDIIHLHWASEQGIIIFLFFSWVTSSQAILTLYRLQTISSWKIAVLMPVALMLVVFTYLLAAEAFTEFLYPAKGEAAFYFHAAAMPWWLFDLIVAVIAFFVVMGWVFIYARSHGYSVKKPSFVTELQIRLYMLLINRLYLDALLFGLNRKLRQLGERIDKNRLFGYVVPLAAAIVVLPSAAKLLNMPVSSAVWLLIAAIAFPLFPLHGIYAAALSRLPGFFPAIVAVASPVFGIYIMTGLLPEIPVEALHGISVLAVFGALYGAFRASFQSRTKPLLAYGSISLFSILWWYAAVAGTFSEKAAVYGCTVALVFGGLLLAWQRVEARYGDIEMERLGGLARPMPRFATLFLLLVMAGAGLPPFVLFFGFAEMLFSFQLLRSDELSWSVPLVLFAWLAASWYLFKMTQRLLFGPHRMDIIYEDLHRSEFVALMLVPLMLIIIGVVPLGFLL